MCENEPISLEYIEDSYIPKLENCITPSLDEITELDSNYNSIPINYEWSEETELFFRNLKLDEILVDSFDYNNDNDENSNGNQKNDYESLEYQTVETEFSTIIPTTTKGLKNDVLLKIAKRFRLKFFATKKSMRDVKVTFIDFSKPYLARISSSDNYKKFLNFGSTDNSNKMSEPTSPAHSVASADIAAEFAALTTEEQERQRAEWSQELARVEDEINTLRTVLASKVRHASDLKRKLGITVWREITDDVNQGLKNVKESTVYQRTESVLKSTAEKTSSIFGGITSGISSKFSQIKNSESMRSIEDKVGSAYENVKTKVSTSRSGSVSSFNDDNNSRVTSPTIPEEKPLS
ncbi:tumor protein D52 isoform X2 [Condylostylus longicornis]|uniref:tumor protein D52 isoform X2 n=1 Tax=Condylostylus longicornis TaxID=2530218 RepID=UPI00244DD4AE|nr:tumor protein D52 isoform X2 [Condylostylus longicornis]